MEDFMARKASASNQRPRVRRQTKSILDSSHINEVKDNITGYNYKNLLRSVRSNPMILNAGIGLGAFFLAKFAIRYYKGHPAIGEFIKDNLDTVEGKFKEYQSSVSVRDEEKSSEARH
jgi:hypothetical protein